jgi:hypothetical protein
LLTLIALGLHVVLAGIGSFYRYESYLVAMWIVSLAASLPTLGAALPRGRRRAAVVLAIALASAPVAAPFVRRGIVAHLQVPTASQNIFEQQIQMARFLAQHYPGAGVVANDIGAINFFAEIDNLDLVGLGTLEIMQSRLAGSLDAARIETLARQRRMQIAMIYDDWFVPYGRLPRSWTKVGEWTIAGNVVLGSDTVAFYAVTPQEIDRLVASLRAFAPSLPPSVKQAGPYTAVP